MSERGLPVRYDLLKDPSTPLICMIVKGGPKTFIHLQTLPSKK